MLTVLRDHIYKQISQKDFFPTPLGKLLEPYFYNPIDDAANTQICLDEEINPWPLGMQ